LRDAHVFVLPSYREAFGIAYLEAMACGLLTIGVEGQGPSAFIISGKTGLLVPPQEVAALAACLRSVLEHPGRFSKIAAAGRKHVAQEYTWLRHAERLTEVYREIVER
jgi:glycosyltransferase involved in cell wall biosynthesis